MKIDPIKKLELRERNWVVHTTHQLTQEAISTYVSENGSNELPTGKIYYGKDGREILVYKVDFFVVEYLVGNNREERKFEFEIYYKNPGANDRWFKWRGEKKTVKQQVRALLRKRILRRAI